MVENLKIFMYNIVAKRIKKFEPIKFDNINILCYNIYV